MIFSSRDFCREVVFSNASKVKVLKRRIDKKKENCFIVIPRTVVLFQQIGYTNERLESARLSSERRGKNEEKKNVFFTYKFDGRIYTRRG